MQRMRSGIGSLRIRSLRITSLGITSLRTRPLRPGVGDSGMSTAEYAVGTIAAAAFAGLLFKIVTSPQVRTLLTGIIKKALELAG